MKVRFVYRRYRLPLRVAVRTAHGLWSERQGVVVRLENEAGQVGLGEAAPISWFGTESVDEVESACRLLDEWGESERFAAVPPHLCCLKNALAAAQRGLSAASSVTESDERVDATDVKLPDYLGVAALLPAGRGAIADLRPKVDAGFRVFKWKVGVADLADELALLDDVCAELPEGAKLRLDANGAWERRQAERWLERCAERPIEFVEQPIGPKAKAAFDALRGLAEDFPTPIALDESLVRDGDVEHWIGAGWPGVYVIKPALMANPAVVLARLSAAKADVVFSSALETAVGAQAGLRAAFTWSGKPRALGFGVWPLFVDSTFDGPHLAPFIRREDVERINPSAVWNALS